MIFHTLAPKRSGGIILLSTLLQIGLPLMTSVSLAFPGEPSNDTTVVPKAPEKPDDFDVDNGDDGYVFETTVQGYRLRPTDETTGFAETIDVREESKTVKTVTDVLSQAVGVQVRQLGGLGSYGVASIRGSTSSQVPVYLDGVLLNTGGISSVDLGDLSLDILDSIEIYRGSTPISLGMGGIGGALSLKTKRFDDPVTELALSYGSWSTARLMALQGGQIGRINTLAILTVQGSKGDFYYLNRNGTLLNDSDDRIQARQNNQHVAYTGLLKLEFDTGSWGWILMDDLLVKRQGVAGIESVPTQNAQLHTFRNSVSLKINKTFLEKTKLQLGASYLTLNDNFDDADNEIGVGHQQSKTKSYTVGGYTTIGFNWASRHSTDLRIGVHRDQFTQENLLENTVSDPSTRVRLGFGIEHTWRPWKAFRLVPGLRIEEHLSKFPGSSIPSSVRNTEAHSSNSFFWSPSIGARWEVISNLTLRANVGRYVRAPNLSELFGDRGSVVGNPELNAEIGINADAGFTYILENRGLLSLMRFDAAWFGSWAEDLISYAQNSQNTIRPVNIDAARILGAETNLQISLNDFLSLQANYTYLHGINLSKKPYHNGRRLPGRPEHEAYGRIEVGRTGKKWGGAMWFNTDYAGRNYLDQANLKEDVLGRLLFGAGLRIERPPQGLTLTIEVKNILNTITMQDDEGRLRPLRDYEAFPLPGRTIFATLHWKIQQPKEKRD